MLIILTTAEENEHLEEEDVPITTEKIVCASLSDIQETATTSPSNLKRMDPLYYFV